MHYIYTAAQRQACGIPAPLFAILYVVYDENENLRRARLMAGNASQKDLQ